MSSSPIQYAQAHRGVFLQQLFDLIRIPSISTEPERAGDVRRTAEWIAAEMTRIGAQHVEIMPTAGHPVVYGDWLGAGATAQVTVCVQDPKRQFEVTLKRSNR